MSLLKWLRERSGPSPTPAQPVPVGEEVLGPDRTPSGGWRSAMDDPLKGLRSSGSPDIEPGLLGWAGADVAPVSPEDQTMTGHRVVVEVVQ